MPSISAELDKLVIYGQNNNKRNVRKRREYQNSHNDLGTLMIFLPSSFIGGDISVRYPSHPDRVFNFSITNGRERKPLKCRYLAFRTDSQYEIKPVTSGIAVALIYKLTRGIPISINSISLLQRKVKNAFQPLSDFTNTLGIFLINSYSNGDCETNNLKGDDRKVYDCLASLPTDKYLLKVEQVHLVFNGYVTGIRRRSKLFRKLLTTALDEEEDVEISVSIKRNSEPSQTNQTRGKYSNKVEKDSNKWYRHVTQIFVGEPDVQVGEVHFINASSLLSLFEDREAENEFISPEKNGIDFKIEYVHSAITITQSDTCNIQSKRKKAKLT